MPRKPLQNLTEPMFYLLLSLQEEKTGSEVVEYVEKLSEGRVLLTPGTLYGLLGRFTEEEIIYVSSVVGKRKSYKLSHFGLEEIYREKKRLERMLRDFEKTRRGKE